MKKGLICLGNPIVDCYAFVSDEFLKKHALPKGSAPVFSPEQVKEIIKDVDFVSVACGGSSLNVAKGVGFAGHKAAVFGQHSDDEDGKIVEEGLSDYSVKNLSIVKKNAYTTRLNCFITPDGQRTMLAIFASSHEKLDAPINFSMFDEYKYLLVEGYYFCNDILVDTAYKVNEYCHKQGLETILLLSNIFCVNSYKNHLLTTLEKSTIISGNDEEFLKLLDKENIEDLLVFLEKHPSLKVSLVTLGPKGAYAVVNGKRYFIEAPDAEVVDTTGAGDYFTAGFLYGYFEGYSVETSLKIANLFAGDVISHVGANLDKNIRSKFEYLLANEKK
ncbi:adenosine kinase-like [Rattus rattus]|uniref:adenosine kinase-like n=1 Tax=Rattus rattus TaxID=10117 RepID=UPI0013F34B95|nr:adenosine kinase-like [Rattus rattus]